MTVLVTAASRRGATTEIAQRIAGILRTRGYEVRLEDPDNVRSLDGVAAVILGSAVYTSGWLRPARNFASRFCGDLTGRAVWLFSSGPVGDPPFPQHAPEEISDLMDRTGARDHMVFAGKIDTAELSLAERLVVRTARVDTGDYRDWAAVAAWASMIADTLDAEAAADARLAASTTKTTTLPSQLPSPRSQP